MTEPFADAAEAQCDSLGLDPAIVYLPHPIQNRTTAELHNLADATVDRIMELLRGGGP
ncbi:MAG: hypothetical protein KIT36_13805 [Alphaproteobacteria bacterium]|nr:hypothetical protein [Alphaproteobacteria bacterium]